MPSKRGIIPREGISMVPIIKLIQKTILNPSLTVPLLLAAIYTEKGRELALGREAWLKRIKIAAYIGLFRWTTAFLNWGALNNWQEDTYDWNKEIVVITGGSGGIGSMIVKLFADRGVKVVVLDVMPLSFEAPKNVHFFKCDITSPAAIAAVSAEIKSKVGAPTVLINNAGVARGRNLLDLTEKDIRLTFDVNALAHYFLAQQFLPDMIARNHGMVVTVASLAAFVTAPQMVDYAASKAAAVAFHEGLAVELKTRYNAPKVRTVLVTQGYTRTPLFVGYKNSSGFMVPTLEPETVAEGIFDQVMKGRSGHVVLPETAGLVCGIRGWAHWMQLRVRNKGSDMMTNWNGRQVIDPNAKKD